MQQQHQERDQVQIKDTDQHSAAEERTTAIETTPRQTQLAKKQDEHQESAAEGQKKEEDKPVANQDAVIEQLSHGMVAKDLDDKDQSFLAVNGYSAGPIIRGKHEFVMRSFAPTVEGKPPIVAFRGTVPSKIDTLIADIDPRGVGIYQFNPNRELIKGTMAAAASRGAVILSGHSLGGALAQVAACTFPDMVSRIVTFQSPGIEPAMIQKLEKYNAEHPDHAIESTHHRVLGDLVPLAGVELTPGVIQNHEMEGGNPLTKHTSLPLTQEELALGHELPVQSDPAVGGLPGQNPHARMRPAGALSTADDHKPTWVEQLRKGVGTVGFGAAAGVRAAGDGIGHGFNNIRKRLGL